MSGSIELQDSPGSAAWDAFVADAEGATVFHTSAWASVWTSEWPGSRWHALVWNENGRIVAGLGFLERRGAFGPRIFSMPDGTYGGPLALRGLAGDTRAPAMDALLGRYREICARAMAAQLTWRVPSGEESSTGGFAAGFTQVVPLAGGFEAVQDRLSHGARSRVKQAEEAGLVLRPVTSEAGVGAYHELAVRNAERHGSRPRPITLYRRVLERLVPAGLARFDLVEHQGKVIGGSLHLLYGGHALNWLTVADETRRDLRPNHFVIGRWLRELSGSGYLEYDLGSSPPDAKGLIEFKESWGAVRRPVLSFQRRGWLYRLLGR